MDEGLPIKIDTPHEGTALWIHWIRKRAKKAFEGDCNVVCMRNVLAKPLQISTRLRNDFGTNENGTFRRLALRKGLEKQVGDGVFKYLELST